MRAVRVGAFGEPPAVVEVAAPVPTAGRTTVRVAAASVGHVDRTIWSGAFLRHPPLPYTPGVEAAGVVERSDAHPVGSRVWVRGGGLGTAADGTWAELVSAPDEAVGPLPDGVDDGVGAAFFSPTTSAWVALHDVTEVQPGQRVAITGATGAVGSMAVQLATDIGAEVVEVVAGLQPAEPVDVLVDTVGGDVLAEALATVRPGGTAVLVGYTAGTALTIDLPTFLQRDVVLQPLNMIRREAAGRAAAPELLARLADGRLRLDITTFPLERAGEALEWLTRRGRRGRAVLVAGGAP